MALRLQDMYPDLFQGMTDEHIREINNSWANQWIEGWEPNRSQVELSIRRRRGEIAGSEYIEAVVTTALQD